jgi:hypothetical protein
MSDFQFREGWTFRPDDILESHARMQDAGLLISGAGDSDGPSFRGEWKRAVSEGRTAFLACTVEPDRPSAYRQSTGVCTSMIYRTLQDCLNWERAKYAGLSRAVRIAFEPIFAGSRVIIGRGQLGSSDGSVGAWIAEWLARYGCVERGTYQGINLNQPDESLAQHWGLPRIGPPDVFQAIGRRHRFKGHKCESVEEVADAMASGTFGGICRSRYSHSIDSDGFARFDSQGGHHTCLRGCFLDPRDRRVFVEQQTHGSGIPDPHPVAHTHEGPIELSDGAYLVREDDIHRYIAAGEIWVFQVRDGEEFR